MYCTELHNAHLKADRGNAEDEVTPIIIFAKIYSIKVHEHNPTHVLTVLQKGRQIHLM